MQTFYKILDIEKKFENENKGTSNTFVFKDGGSYIMYNYCTGWFISVIRYHLISSNEEKLCDNNYCYYKIANINHDPYINYDKYIGTKKIIAGSQEYKYDPNDKKNIKNYNKKYKQFLFKTIEFL